MTEAVKKIVAALVAVKCDLRSEPQTHTSIAEAFKSAGIAFEHEVRIGSRDRLDFLAHGGVVIEVKLDGSARDILRQITRYSEVRTGPANDRVTAIIVATARAVRMPKVINGVPVFVVSLTRAWL